MNGTLQWSNTAAQHVQVGTRLSTSEYLRSVPLQQAGRVVVAIVQHDQASVKPGTP